jgi:hypothetical protein
MYGVRVLLERRRDTEERSASTVRKNGARATVLCPNPQYSSRRSSLHGRI